MSAIYYDTYYDFLGVSREASSDKTKQAYKKLMRTLHPDSYSDDKQMTEGMKILNIAYETLSDPINQVEYDEHLSHPSTVQPLPAQPHYRTPSPSNWKGWLCIVIWFALALFIIILVANITRTRTTSVVSTTTIQVKPQNYTSPSSQGDTLPGICKIDSTLIHHVTDDYFYLYLDDSNLYKKIISSKLQLNITILNGKIHLRLLDIRAERPDKIADLIIGDDGNISEGYYLDPSWFWRIEPCNVLMEDSQFGRDSVCIKRRGFPMGITISFDLKEIVTSHYIQEWEYLDDKLYTFTCPAGDITISF
ncbi:J domain-containing protein [Patescibacteria group bacterium]|nr:J domain-containing protein [Patescibacteria group bacterium]